MMTEPLPFPLNDTSDGSSFEQWRRNNDAHLNAILGWVSRALGVEEEDGVDRQTALTSIVDLNRHYLTNTHQIEASAVNLLINQFGLDASDQAALALCVAAALEPAISERCGILSGNIAQRAPSAMMAVNVLPECCWSSFSPHSPLRYWLLIDWQPLGAGDAYLMADERVVNFVRGLNYIDERLSVLLESPASDASSLAPSQQAALDAALAFLNQNLAFAENNAVTVVELFGEDKAAKLSMGKAISEQLGLHLQRLSVSSLPSKANDLDALARLWLREAGLLPMLLMIDDVEDVTTHGKVTRFLNRLGGWALVDSGQMAASLLPRSFPLEVKRPTVAEQTSLWRRVLKNSDVSLSERLAEHFSLSEQEIVRASSIAAAKSGDSDKFEQNLFHVCQQNEAAGLGKLAQRIECKATWHDLVLPDPQTRVLEQLSAQVALRHCVYQQWGFRDKMSRGMGISAMFSGESGTGKTMAAEVIANALNLDLFRIDLASVMSKYIGESEKQMRSLFQAAERCGAILFFDEADALFGKRGDVKNSNDRFSNIGIDDLLQRIETYSGLAILATNLKSSVDKAFLRRLRFVVDFPFPGPVERERIWRTVFPSQTPLAKDVDTARLAKLNLTGGNIHTVALNGAFLAAQHNEDVSMRWLMEAAAGELQKLERPIKAGDLDYG